MRFLLSWFIWAVACAANGASWVFVPTGDPYTTNYYIDSVSGSDSNNGLSTAAPFQTLHKMQTIIGTTAPFTGLSPWTAIHLKHGSTWTGADAWIASDVSNVKVDSSLPDGSDYGAGGIPVLDGRVVMTAGGWTVDSGACYKYTFTALVDTAEQHNIWEDGVRLVRTASSGACAALAGSYYVPPEGGSWVAGSPTTMYVHASDGSNPASSGKVYKTQGVVKCFQLGSTTSVSNKLYDVDACGGCHHNGNVEMGRNSYAQGVIVRWGTIHSLYTDSGFFVNCTSYDCELGFDFVANKGSATDGFIEMNGCVSDLSATSDIVQNSAFFVHGDTQATIRYINCIAREHAIGFGVNGCPNGQTILIQGCTVTSSAVNADQQFHAFDLTNRDVSPSNSTTVTIEDCLADGYGVYLQGIGWNVYTTFTVNKARFVSRNAQTCINLQNATGEVKYSSFYAPSNGGYSGLEIIGTATVNWHNNVVDGCGTGTEQFGATTYTANNNLWHFTGSGPEMRVASTYYGNYAAYVSGGWEASSSNSAPDWVQAPSIAHNFATNSGSPTDALSAGWSHAP